MLDDYPRFKRLLHFMLVHPYTAKTRRWARLFVLPWFIKRGKGSIIRWNARLDIIPSKKLVLGKRAIIEEYAIINNGVGDVIIGDYSKVLSRTTIVGPVTIGKKVVVGNGTQIAGMIHNFGEMKVPIDDQGVSAVPTVICDDVWIGGNSTVNQGVVIGSHSLIGAGSVVVHNVEPYSIVAGNPAKTIKRWNESTHKWERI